MHSLLLVFAITALGLRAQSTPKDNADRYKTGHSHLGETFDTGPRQKPWVMPGIGAAHLPITTGNPEVQKWFDQGITLLHSFWDYEAERAFRWCLKLEPENAMAWWGLAKATSGERSEEFVRQAVKRKGTASERERLYIEALEKLNSRDALRDRSDDYRQRDREYKKTLETLIVQYPDETEAKAMLALANMGDSRYGTELIVREVLAKHPDHPGAHHYRIHNWNYHEPEMALASCRRYGEIAPGIGHALHMPGHVYATAGMWHEAAISMDAATRAEKRYMLERLTFPFNNWNYGHNRAYLSYIQEQLGMADAALFGARQLIDAPLDPDHNGDLPYSSHSQGLLAMTRALVKFERWADLRKPSLLPWRDIFRDKMLKAYVETRSHLGAGDVLAAGKSFVSLGQLRGDLAKNKQFETTHQVMETELKARFALAKGDTLTGLQLLAEAAQKQFDMQKGDNDPPNYPEVLFNALGRAYLDNRSPQLAAQAFEKALLLTRNDIWALSGLVQAHHASGDRDKAGQALSNLLFVASGADAGAPPVARALATGLKAQPRDNSPATQRKYSDTDLSKHGPNVWEPFAAPALDAVDAASQPVTLSEYRGRNVILVFYLGRECLHCMKQLRDLTARKSDWDRLDTAIVAVSGNTPEANTEALKTLQLPGVRLLSDREFANARRYRSYDDFEEMELHSTILIDRKGRVHWARTGGEPFSKTDFLVKQIERMNAAVASATENPVSTGQ